MSCNTVGIISHRCPRPFAISTGDIDHVRAERPLHALEAEMTVQPLASAQELGLSEDWVRRLAQANPIQRQALTVVRLVGGSPASHLLQQGDQILG